MACLVAPGALRAVVAISVARPAGGTAASAGASLGSVPADGIRAPRSLGGGRFFNSNMHETATNAAAAAAAAAALAALATGSLSLGLEGGQRAPINPEGGGMLLRKRQCVLAALGASLGPHASDKGPLSCPPLGLPGWRCSPVLNSQWVRDCVAGRLQQHQSLAVATAIASAATPSVAQPFGSLPGATYRALATGIETFRDGALVGLGGLMQGALSLYREGEEMATCTLRALHAWRRIGPWAPLGGAWRSRLNAKGLVMRRIVRRVYTP